jgi:hypothetical protein
MDKFDAEYTNWMDSHRSEGTKTTYEAGVSSFAKWAGLASPDKVAALLLGGDVRDAEGLLQGWTDHICATMAPKTTRTRVAGMRAFIRYMFAHHTLPWLPQSPKFSMPNIRVTKARVADAVSMIASLDLSTDRGLRDAVLIDLLSLIHLAADVAALNVENVVDHGEKVTVTFKSSPPKLLGETAEQAAELSSIEMSGAAAGRLTEWVHRRGVPTGPLFVGVLPYGGQKEERLVERAIRKRMNAISVGSGGGRLSPRDLSAQTMVDRSGILPADGAKLMAYLSKTNLIGA